MIRGVKGKKKASEPGKKDQMPKKGHQEKEAGRVAEEEKDVAKGPESETSPSQEGEEKEQAKLEEEKELAGKVAELEDRLLRLRAEYANYKRRTDKEKTEIAAHVKAGIYRGIIPVVDDFGRFFEHLDSSDNNLDEDFLEGIHMIRNSLVSALEKQGIEVVAETGVPFDPHIHEAMLTEPVEDKKDDNTVRRVIEVGYRLGDMVIRPAKVTVGMFG
ncbi:MAG: nucleotide exchange factor GrpE [Gemmatimonadota bacterium]|nr:nucleotide exchange factor GrpE [Gemmatimonadota bacterium]